jgi:hypothetical protein
MSTPPKHHQPKHHTKDHQPKHHTKHHQPKHHTKHHKSHKNSYKASKRKHKIDYYNLPDRNDALEEHYASIHASYSTVEQLNVLIEEFYKPKCSLHINVPKDTLIKYPDMSDLLVHPGQGPCLGSDKDKK